MATVEAYSPAMMPATRRKPLLVNLLLTCGLIVVVLMIYVGAYVGSWYLTGAQVVPESITDPLDQTLFAPLAAYEDSGWPGAERFSDWCDRALWTGAEAAER